MTFLIGFWCGVAAGFALAVICLLPRIRKRGMKEGIHDAYMDMLQY